MVELLEWNTLEGLGRTMIYIPSPLWAEEGLGTIAGTTLVSLESLSHTSPSCSTKAAPTHHIPGNPWWAFTPYLPILPQWHRSEQLRTLQVHITSTSDGLLGYCHYTALLHPPAHTYFSFSCPTRVSPAQSAPGTSMLPWFQPPHQGNPCVEHPRTPQSASCFRTTRVSFPWSTLGYPAPYWP